MEKGSVRDHSPTEGIDNPTIEGELPRTTEPSGLESEPKVHVFNEQTNYVPKKTIITVNLSRQCHILRYLN